MMNLKSWMRIGGIIALLLGTAPMLAVAQSYGSPQFDLFEDTATQISLMRQLDHIRHRWGYSAIKRAVMTK